MTRRTAKRPAVRVHWEFSGSPSADFSVTGRRSAPHSRSGGRAGRRARRVQSPRVSRRRERRKNVGKRLPEQVPQRKRALVVKAARHDRAVGKHGDLVAERAAAALAPTLCRLLVRPVKALSEADEHTVLQPPAPRIFLPHAGKGRVQLRQNLRVPVVQTLRLRAVEIPEAEICQESPDFFAAWAKSVQPVR